MAGKLKNAPRRSKPKAAKPSRASRIPAVEEITDAEREGVIAKLLAEQQLEAKATADANGSDEGAAEVWRRALLTNRLPPLDVELLGGMRLTAIEDGVKVAIEDRLSVISWSEIVQACRDEWGEDTDEDPVAKPERKTKVDRLKGISDTFGAASKALRIQAGSKFVDCPPEGVLCVVLTAVVEPNPFQPRLDFNAVELTELAASIAAHGQLTPVDVRPKPGCHGAYQIADGERRWRAIKELGRNTIEVRIVPRTDEQMAVIGMETAVRRVELNPIEKARQFLRFVEEFGWTQQQVADKYDTSQGQVAHLLRLLRLPQRIQDRIMARDIPASHARLLVPFAEAHASFWDRLEKQAGLGKRPIAALGDFEHEIMQALGWETANLDRQRYSARGCVLLPKLTVSDEQRAALGVVELTRSGSRKAEQQCYATNLTALKKLVAQQEKEFFRAHPEKACEQAKPAKAAKAAKGKQPEKGVAKEKGITTKLLEDWLHSWRQYLISRAGEGLASDDGRYTALRVLLAVSGGIDARDWIRACSTILGPKAKVPENCWRVGTTLADVTKRLSAVQLADAERHMLRNAVAFSPAKGPGEHTALRFDRDLTGALCCLLELDLATIWQQELAGPLTHGYLELHSREQLAALLRECGEIPPAPTTAKKEFIARLEKSTAFKTRLPRELAELFSPPAKTRKGGKK